MSSEDEPADYTFPLFSEDDFESSFNLSSDSYLRPSNSSYLFVPSPTTRSGPSTSTPKKRRPKPSVKSGVPDKVHVCSVCGKKFKTDKTLSKHSVNHKLEAATARKPSTVQLQTHCLKEAPRIIREIGHAAVTDHSTGPRWNAFLEKVLEKAEPEPTRELSVFVLGIVEVMEPIASAEKNSKQLLPSSIQEKIHQLLLQSLASDTGHIWLDRILQVATGDSENVSDYENAPDVLLLEFVREMCKSVTAYVVHLMKNTSDDIHSKLSRRISSDDYDTLFNQQTLHYVAGSCVRGLLRKCRQYPNSARFQKYKEVVLKRIASVGTSVADRQEASSWTALLARKAFVFVNGSALNFFIEVAKVFCYTETHDGSLPRENVLKNIFGSPSLVAIWEGLIGSALSQDESLSLMRMLVISLCGTFGRGVLL